MVVHTPATVQAVVAVTLSLYRVDLAGTLKMAFGARRRPPTFITALASACAIFPERLCVGMLRPENGSEFEIHDDVRSVSNFCRAYVKRWRPRGTCHDRCHPRHIRPGKRSPSQARRAARVGSMGLAEETCSALLLALRWHWRLAPPSHPLPDDANLPSVRWRPSAWLRCSTITLTGKSALCQLRPSLRSRNSWYERVELDGIARAVRTRTLRRSLWVHATAISMPATQVRKGALAAGGSF